MTNAITHTPSPTNKDQISHPNGPVRHLHNAVLLNAWVTILLHPKSASISSFSFFFTLSLSLKRLKTHTYLFQLNHTFTITGIHLRTRHTSHTWVIIYDRQHWGQAVQPRDGRQMWLLQARATQSPQNFTFSSLQHCRQTVHPGTE